MESKLPVAVEARDFEQTGGTATCLEGNPIRNAFKIADFSRVVDHDPIVCTITLTAKM